MIDWRQFNKSADIPAEVIQQARQYTQDKVVVDFGSGIDEFEHIDFHAARAFRIEKNALHELSDRNAGLAVRLRALPSSERLVLVFFRVISILSSAERQDITSCLQFLRSRVETVIVYDYTLDERKSAEYVVTNSCMGTLHGLHVEWAQRVFYHLSRTNLTWLIPLPVVVERYVQIPAHKRMDGRGIFMVFRDEAAKSASSP